MKNKFKVYLALLTLLSAFIMTPAAAINADTNQTTESVTTGTTGENVREQEEKVGEEKSTQLQTEVLESPTIKNLTERPPNRPATEVKALITHAALTTSDGQSATTVDQYSELKIVIDFKLPNTQLQAGDYSVIKLPAELKLKNPENFVVGDGSGNIVANAVVDPVEKMVKLIYTDFVEQHSDIQGSLALSVRIDQKVVTENKKLPLTLDFNGQAIPLGEVQYQPGVDDPDEEFSKSAWFLDNGKTIQYALRINGAKNSYQNAVISDDLLSEGMKYRAGSFAIKKGNWILTANGNSDHGFFLENEVDVSDQFKVEMATDQRSFKVDLGDINSDDGYLIIYQVEIGHTPISGEKFKNHAQMAATKIIPIEYTATVTYETSSGSATGYNYQIELQKVDERGQPLAQAVFEIIRNATGEKVQTVTTDNNGLAQVKGLLRDDYTIVEVQAPVGYERTEAVSQVKATEFGTDNSLVRRIVNQPKTVKIAGQKIWQDNADQDGKRPAQIKVELLADGKVIRAKTVTQADKWQYDFGELPEYASGKKINYTLIETPVAGYQSEVKGYDLYNTHVPLTTNFEVEKVWQDEQDKAKKRPQTIEVQLLADGKAYGEKVALTAAGHWQYEWQALPVYQNGKKVTYQIREVTEVAGYTSKQERMAPNKVILMNVYTPTPDKPEVPDKDKPGEDKPAKPDPEKPGEDKPNKPVPEVPNEDKPDKTNPNETDKGKSENSGSVAPNKDTAKQATKALNEQKVANKARSNTELPQTGEQASYAPSLFGLGVIAVAGGTLLRRKRGKV